MRREQTRFGLAFSSAIVLVWIVVVGAGMLWLSEYANRPGDAGHPQRTWPPQSRLVPSSTSSTLVMFAHPHCPCTRASINELAVLMAQAGDRLDAHVLFLLPDEADPNWSQTDLWRAAERIPRVEVFADAGSDEIDRFGTATSGQVLLYDRHGRLRFQGGITASRGHAGDNLGRSSILQLLNKAGDDEHDQSCVKGPVFGCQLFE